MLRFSLVPAPVHRFLPDAGVTAYCIVSHAAPVHGSVHTQVPPVQAPLREHWKAVVHAAPPCCGVCAAARDRRQAVKPHARIISGGRSGSGKAEGSPDIPSHTQAFSPDRGNFNVIAGSRDRSNRDREEKQNKIYKLIGPNHGRAEEPRQSATPPARAAQRCDRVFALRAIGDARNATPLIAWSEWTACRPPSVAAAICFPSPATTRTNHHATLSLSLSPRPGALALCVGGCAPCQGLPPAAAPASALPPSSPSPPQSGSKS